EDAAAISDRGGPPDLARAHRHVPRPRLAARRGRGGGTRDALTSGGPLVGTRRTDLVLSDLAPSDLVLGEGEAETVPPAGPPWPMMGILRWRTAATIASEDPGP